MRPTLRAWRPRRRPRRRSLKRRALAWLVVREAAYQVLHQVPDARRLGPWGLRAWIAGQDADDLRRRCEALWRHWPELRFTGG